MKEDEYIEKVVITGLGTVSPLGNNSKEFWENLCAKFDPADKIQEDGIGNCIGKKAVQMKGVIHVPSKWEKYNKCYKMVLKAVQEALYRAQLGIEHNNKRIGLCIGSTAGNAHDLENYYLSNMGKDLTTVPYDFIKNYPVSSITDIVASEFGIKGMQATISNACISSALAIQTAYEWVSRGKADIVICGGVDVFRLIQHHILSKYKLISAEFSRPLDANRSGFLLGEAAGILVLEAEDSAKQRESEVLAKLCGIASAFDKTSVLGNSTDSCSSLSAMKKVITEAGLRIDDIDLIYANANGTKQGDIIEVRAFNSLFQNRKEELYISSVEGALGHASGASGCMSSIASVLSIVNNIIPPILHHQETDNELMVGRIAKSTVTKKLNNVLCNNYNFNGNKLSLLFGRY